jgi:23S rRNA (cytosine1962-C5)-methyltransferase
MPTPIAANSALLRRWTEAIERRERWLASSATDDTDLASADSQKQNQTRTMRWLHSDGDPLRIEQLGPVLALSWFKDQEPNEQEQASIDAFLEILKEKTGCSRWYFQIRSNRGRTPNEEALKFSPGVFEPRWEAQENGLKYGFRIDSGLSAGLFLDQRRNRAWVREHAKGKTVLNLFCYTGGFSVSAAAGGAVKTVSVDVSKTFLEWAKENFTRNNLSVEGHEFRAMDSREYLAWARKKELLFDLVICDPPSFSRTSSKAGLFRIEQDFATLLNSLIDVTKPGGQILFSSNYEAWTLGQFEFEAQKILHARKTKLTAQLAATPPPDLDFEPPNQPRNMKSFLVKISEIK